MIAWIIFGIWSVCLIWLGYILWKDHDPNRIKELDRIISVKRLLVGLLLLLLALPFIIFQHFVMIRLAARYNWEWLDDYNEKIFDKGEEIIDWINMEKEQEILDKI